MAWFGALALLIVAMLTLSMVGAERNFRRSREDPRLRSAAPADPAATISRHN
jgi:hypothetical protein